MPPSRFRDADLEAAADGPITPIPFGPRSSSLLLLGSKGWLVGYSVREASGAVPGLTADTVVPVTNPAAGADWSVTLAAGGRLRVARGQLQASAAVANRVPSLEIRDASSNLLFRGSGPTATAGQGIRYNWAPGLGFSSVIDGVTASVPDLLLPAGAVINVSTNSIQGGDQWSGVTLTVTTSTSGAVCDLIDGSDANGAVLAAVGLGAGLSTDQSFGGAGIPFDSGLFLNVASGSVRGAVYVRLAA